MPVAFVILLLGLLFFAGSSANANDRPKISGDHETRASDRVDVRYRYRNLPKDKEDHQVTLRSDFAYHFDPDLFLNNNVSTAAWRMNNRTNSAIFFGHRPG
jgi:hypothetical protein